VSGGFTQAVRLLIAHDDIDVNKPDRFGKTPLNLVRQANEVAAALPKEKGSVIASSFQMVPSFEIELLLLSLPQKCAAELDEIVTTDAKVDLAEFSPDPSNHTRTGLRPARKAPTIWTDTSLPIPPSTPFHPPNSTVDVSSVSEFSNTHLSLRGQLFSLGSSDSSQSKAKANAKDKGRRRK